MKKRLAFACLAMLLPGLAAAGEGNGGLEQIPTFVLSSTVISSALLVVGSPTTEIARLGSGGCIRGPFSVRDAAGRELFTLSAGVTYPTNCDKE